MINDGYDLHLLRRRQQWGPDNIRKVGANMVVREGRLTYWAPIAEIIAGTEHWRRGRQYARTEHPRRYRPLINALRRTFSPWRRR